MKTVARGKEVPRRLLKRRSRSGVALLPSNNLEPRKDCIRCSFSPYSSQVQVVQRFVSELTFFNRLPSQDAKKRALRKAQLKAQVEAEEAKMHPFQPMIVSAAAGKVGRAGTLQPSITKHAHSLPSLVAKRSRALHFSIRLNALWHGVCGSPLN